MPVVRHAAHAAHPEPHWQLGRFAPFAALTQASPETRKNNRRFYGLLYYCNPFLRKPSPAASLPYFQ